MKFKEVTEPGPRPDDVAPSSGERGLVQSPDRTGPAAEGPARTPFITALVVIVCLVPFVFISLVVLRYAVNVPIADDWSLVESLQKDRVGSIPFQDLWDQHNEHRLVLPKLVMLMLARLTMWDVRYQLIISLACALISYGVIFLLLRRTVGITLGSTTLVALVAASVIIFSPVRATDWIWGWQIQWFMSVMALMLAVGFLELWPEDRPEWPAVASSALASTIGLYSLSNGAFIWGAGLVVMLLRPRYRRFWLPWVVAAAATTGPYLIDYHKPPHHPPTSYFFEHPRESFDYLAYYLGRPLSDSQSAATALGLVLAASFVALTAYLLVTGKARLPGVAGWIAISCYVMGSAVITGIARVGLGTEQAGSAKYTNITVLLVISVLALATVGLGAGQGPSRAKGKAALGVSLWVVACGVFLYNYPAQIREIASDHDRWVQARQCVMTVSSPHPCLAAIYYDPVAAYELTQILKRNELGPFAVASGQTGRE